MMRKIEAPVFGSVRINVINNSWDSNAMCSAAGTDDDTHEYDYLGAWGPRFDKLADLYGPDLDEQL